MVTWLKFGKWFGDTKGVQSPFQFLVQLMGNKVRKSDPVVINFNLTLDELLKCPDLSVSRISEDLSLKSVSELNLYSRGQKELTFKFLEKVSKIYGVSSNWLKHGETPMFSSADDARFLYTDQDYARAIENHSYDIIYLLRSQSDCAEVSLIGVKNKLYHVYPNIVHLSEHNGGTGKSQLTYFYRLLEYFYNVKYSSARMGNLPSICAMTVDVDTYNKIAWGSAYVGSEISLNRMYSNEMNWWTDVVWCQERGDDCDYNELEKRLGKSFVNAMEIIKTKKRSIKSFDLKND